MLVITLSASVYGIDAYLVEVEVDVGSADMNQFNVVGLPDNAVKESRERIKATLKKLRVCVPLRPGRDNQSGACTPPMIQRYVSKISEPLLDRIDIQIEVPSLKYKELRAPQASEDSAAVRTRVIAACKRQHKRFTAEKNTYSNAQMAPKMIRKHCAISADGEKLLENAVSRLGLSARVHDRILKVSRTIADLAGSESIGPSRGDPVPHPGPVILGLG
jgi:predicted ATPase with chaperone activity